MTRHNEQLLLSEIQVLLAEKRTYYAVLRTGLGIITVPLTVIIFLTATSEYHKIFSYFWVGFVIISALLIVSLAGMSVFIHAQAKLRRLKKMIKTIEDENKRVAEIVI